MMLISDIHLTRGGCAYSLVAGILPDAHLDLEHP
jgi:hypothetical protein